MGWAWGLLAVTGLQAARDGVSHEEESRFSGDG